MESAVKLRVPIMSISELEATLEFQLKAAKLNRHFVREYAAIEGRRWRWDFAAPRVRLLIELQGGIWMGKQGRGAHSTGAAIQRDCEKHNAATMAGWRQLSFTRLMVESGEALRLIEKYMAGAVDGGSIKNQEL